MQSASTQRAGAVLNTPERLMIRLLDAASWAFVALGVCFTVVAVVFLLRHYRDIPYWDHWIWLARYYEAGLPGVLFTQFNEHRLFFPSFFILADLELFGASNLSLVILILACQAVCTVILVRPLWTAAGVPRPLARVMSSVAAVLMLWLVQGENLLWPFQIHTIMANTAALAAVLVFSIYVERGSRAAWLGTLALGTVASYSFAHGMLIWPVLLLLGLAARVPARRLLWVSAVFAVLLAIYLIGYRTPAGHGSPAAAFTRPLDVLHYVVVFLALPAFGPGRGDLIGANVPAYAAGVAGLLAGSAFILRTLLVTGKQRRSDEIICSGAMLLVIAGAFVTGLGRVGMSAAQALSSRYGTLSLIFWIALLAAIAIELARWETGTRGAGRAMWALMLVAGTLMVSRAQATAMRDYAALERDRTAAVISVLAGAPDPLHAGNLVYPEPALLEALRPRMQSNREYFYDWPIAGWLNRPLAQTFRVTTPGACRGAVDRAESYLTPASQSRAGVRAVGWAQDTARNGPAQAVVFTDIAGTIAGAAVLGTQRPDIAAATGNERLLDAGWTGYTRYTGGQPVTAWAILSSGEACPLGQRTPVPRKQ